jgi:hypothetical protein
MRRTVTIVGGSLGPAPDLSGKSPADGADSTDDLRHRGMYVRRLRPPAA